MTGSTGLFLAGINYQASFPKLVTDCALSLLYTAPNAASGNAAVHEFFTTVRYAVARTKQVDSERSCLRAGILSYRQTGAQRR